MGIQINGNNDIISALDGSWTAEGASINTSGILTATTFKGNIVGTAATFTGPVTIGGTLTYEDVTNIDSVGIITARNNIHLEDYIYHKGDPDTYIGFSGANTITAKTTGVERLLIDSTGILKLYGDNGSNSLIYGHRAGSLTYILGNQSGSNDFNIKTWASSTNIIFSLAGNNEKVRITSAGKVGIGSTIPTNALDVQAGTTNTAIVARSTDSKAQISLLDNSTTSVGSVVIGAEGDALFLTSGSGGTERLRINSGGGCHLGIPATTKGWDTHAISLTTNSATFACPATVAIFGGTGHGTANMAGGGIRFVGYYAAGQFTTFAHVAGVKENTVSGEYGGALTFHTRVNGGLGAERLRIASDGDVGIGTDNPQYELHVWPPAATSSGQICAQSNGNNTFAELVLKTDGGVGSLWRNSSGKTDYGGANSLNIYQSANANIAFFTAGNNQRLLITGTGEIQTKTRSAEVRRMILSGSPSNSAFNIEAHDGESGTSSGDVQGKLGLFYNDGSTLTNTACISFERGSGAPDGAMAFVTNQAERLRIRSDGKLQIGTAGGNATYLALSGNAAMDLWGDGSEYPTLRLGTENYNTVGEDIRFGRKDQGAADIRYHSLKSKHGSSAAENYLEFFLHDFGSSPYTSQRSSLKVQGDGRVGVKNNLNYAFNTSSNTLCIGDGGGAVGLTIWTAAGADSQNISFHCNETLSRAEGEISYGPVNTTTTANRNAMMFRVNSGERLRISSGGQVRMNTAGAPAADLHVGGTGAALNAYFVTSRTSGAYHHYAIGNSGASLGYIGSAGQISASGGATSFAFRSEADTQFCSGGSAERMRLSSDGYFLVNCQDTGYSSSYTDMTIGNTSAANTGLTIASSPTNGYSRIHFADGTSGTAKYAGFIAYAHGSDAMVFGTGNSGSSKLEMMSDGEIVGNGGANGKVRYNSCQRWQWGGSASCNSTWSVSIPPLTGGGAGNIYQIKAYFSHHSLGYGAYLDGVYCAYAGHTGMQQNTDHHSHTSPNGGSWTVTRASSGSNPPVVVTHNAGSYNGSGHWFVWVLAGHQ